MFKQANGLKYTHFMRALHSNNLFDWYMEIGCRAGDTFAPVRGKTIAVDPFFQVKGDIIGVKPSLHIFQQTSDDFFASGFIKMMKIKLSFSFLDGMHLFEFLLRDFIATEKASDPNGVIALHDCCPFSHEMTTRDLSNLPKKAWTGDVWKLIPILAEYRPDLKLTVLDANPTGVVLISGLNPKSKTLEKHYDDILAAYTDVTLENFGLEKFNALFDYESTQAFVDSGFPLFNAISLDPSLALEPIQVTY